MAEDNALVSRAQAGDEQAFTDLVKRYHTFVYAVVSALLDNRQDIGGGGARRVRQRLPRFIST